MKFPGLLSFSALFLLIGMMSLFLPAFAASIDSPLKQVEMGVEPEDVTCKDNFQLLIRYSGEPACVKPKSADRLVDAGWGTTIQSMKMMGPDHKDRDVMSTQDTDTKQEQTMKMTHKPMMVGGIDVAMSPTLEGDQNAPITIIEFGDFQCPKCYQWFTNEKPTITEQYIDTGKANLYFVDFVSAANAAHCADDQGKYWEYHNMLYNNQGRIDEGWASSAALKGFAVSVGLDQDKFEDCLDSDKHAYSVSYNKLVGTDNGVEGTPVFFIVDSNGNSERIDGPQPAEVFAEVIDSMLGRTMMPTETESVMEETFQ